MRRRFFLGGTAGLAASASLPVFNINHAFSQDVTFDGQAFDAGGATLRIHDWPGQYEKIRRKVLFEPFEQEFNCRIVNQNEPGVEEFGDLTPESPKEPQATYFNNNLMALAKISIQQDFFLEQDAVLDNVPALKDTWLFAVANGLGVTWAYMRLGYGYRTDLVDTPPTDFGAYTTARFNGQRLGYSRDNTFLHAWLMTANDAFGRGPRDLEAGLAELRKVADMAQPGFSTAARQKLVEGDYKIAILPGAEVFVARQQGAPVDIHLWQTRQTVITQTATVARYADPLEKKLALALIDRSLRQEAQEAFFAQFPMRPVHRQAAMAQPFAERGEANDRSATAQLWIPDWFWLARNWETIDADLKKILAS